LRLRCQQQVNQFNDKGFKNEAERQPFEKVQQPVLQRHCRKSVAMSEYKTTIVAQWRADDLVAQHQGQEVEQYLPGKPARNGLPAQWVQYSAQPRAQAAEEHDKHACRGYRQVNQQEAMTYARVLACFLLSVSIKLCMLLLSL